MSEIKNEFEDFDDVSYTDLDHRDDLASFGSVSFLKLVPDPAFPNEEKVKVEYCHDYCLPQNRNDDDVHATPLASEVSAANCLVEVGEKERQSELQFKECFVKLYDLIKNDEDENDDEINIESSESNIESSKSKMKKNKHVSKEDPQKWFCQLCELSFARKGALTNHEKTHSNEEQRRLMREEQRDLESQGKPDHKLPCKFCERTFNHRHALTNHENMHKNKESIKERKKLNMREKRKLRLIKNEDENNEDEHNENEKNENDEDENNEDEINEDENTEKRRRIKRNEQYTNEDEAKLKTLDPKFTCKFCERIFSHQRTLSNHENMHKNKDNIRERQKLKMREKRKLTRIMKIENENNENENNANENNENDNNEKQRRIERQESIKERRKLKMREKRKLMRNKPSVQILQCQHCEYTGKTAQVMKAHERKHTGELFRCHSCDYSCTRRYMMNLHEKRHSGKGMFQCRYCEYKSIRQYDRVVHERTHTGKKPFQCRHCEFGFSKKKSLDAHEAKHGTVGSPDFQSFVAKGWDGPGTIVGIDQTFQCKICEFSCTDKNLYLTHTREHTKGPFHCQYCDYSCKHRQSMVLHRRKHTKQNLFECKFCDYSTVMRNSLTVHERTHTRKSSFLCKYCDFTTDLKDSLDAHEKIHTGERPLKCQYCDYACIVKKTLRKHEMKMHSNEMTNTDKSKSRFKIQDEGIANKLVAREKSFQCSFCEFNCHTSQSLKRHERKHTGEKPYVCSFCDFATR